MNATLMAVSSRSETNS